MTEEHETGRDLGDPLAESRASDELHLVVMVVGGIKDTIRRTVGDQDVESLWDVVPDPVDGATILHVGPVTVTGCEGRAPDPESIDADLFIDEEPDPESLDQVAGDQTLLEGGVVISRDEDLRRDRERGKPVDEGAKLRLVAASVTVIGRITAVDHHVNPRGDDKLVLITVCIRDVPDFHDRSLSWWR